MNCNTFKKYILKMINGKLPKDLEKAMKNHMNRCNSCKEVYYEKLNNEEILKKLIKDEKISSKDKFIDDYKNEYKFYKKEKKYNFFIISIVILIFIICGIIVEKNKKYIFKVNGNNNFLENGEKVDQSLEKQIDKIKHNYKINGSEVMPKIRYKILNNYYNTNWKVYTYNNEKYEAVIDNNKESKLIVKFNGKNSFIKEYYICNNANDNIYFKDISWTNEGKLLIAINKSYGNEKYGEIYLLDVNKNKLSLIYNTKENNQLIKSISVSKDKEQIQIILSEDSNKRGNNLNSNEKIIKYSKEDILNREGYGYGIILNDIFMALRNKNINYISNEFLFGFDKKENAKIVNIYNRNSKISDEYLNITDFPKKEYFKELGFDDFKVLLLKGDEDYISVVLGKVKKDSEWKIISINCLNNENIQD
ncbi:DUF4652 domain-containing protein [Clostridium fallax]|uniref:Zinc-finger n=1 Tax=Clostridium fallax TaxID=1533 RepID=A0A1M4TU39_9CLOT|nr:DUF4652 domain-containing protein [Clostridium fallax]SHE47962.1 protein of unknown function [Clostridium fallax]SQB22394.1 Uncharacterised protein [Clostridium fallax]